MEIQDIMAELQRYIRQQYKVAEKDPDFTDDVHLFDYGYIDSFGAVDLIAFVEKTFQVKIKESDLIAYPLNTIRDIATFVTKRQKGEI
jgi:methoxymalonate biosynthesis acyl carrier protein